MSVSESVALQVRGRARQQSAIACASADALAPQAIRLRHYQPLVIVLGAVCAGIVADRYGGALVPACFGFWCVLVAAALVAWLPLWRLRRDWASMAAVLISVMSLAAAWHHDRWNLFGHDELGLVAKQTPQPICIEAIVASAPGSC